MREAEKCTRPDMNAWNLQIMGMNTSKEDE